VGLSAWLFDTARNKDVMGRAGGVMYRSERDILKMAATGGDIIIVSYKPINSGTSAEPKKVKGPIKKATMEKLAVTFAVLLAGLVCSVSAFDPSAGLVGHWAFDEALSDTVATDSSGRDNHGTIHGATRIANGRIGGALSFDGTDDYVVTPGDSLIDFEGGPFTVTFWMKSSVSGTTQYYMLANRRDVGDGKEHISIRHWSVHDINFDVVDYINPPSGDRRTTHLSVPDIDFVTGEWVHVGAVRDTQEGRVRLYADAVLKGSTEDITNYTYPMTQGLVFGVDTDGWIRYFPGQLDDIRVYNYALSADDIAGLYQLLQSVNAWSPSPFDGEQDVRADTRLCWNAGADAVRHHVYFGTDFADVNDGDTASESYKGSQSVDANTYNPGELELGRTYYWRIDEVNDTTIWKGNVWSFTVAEYIVVDDFEDYNGITIHDAWADGTSQAPSNGARISIDVEFAHTGSQSMRFVYDNNVVPFYSEAGRTFGIAQDWTRYGARVLSLWFCGDPNNHVEKMYVGAEDSSGYTALMPYDGDINDVKVAEWQEWNIGLAEFNDVNLATVEKIYVVFGDKDSSAPGGTGTVYFDDIRLYPCRSGGLDSDFTGDCVVDLKDLAIMASEWLGEGNLEADLYADCKVDFLDYAILANSWLAEQLWVGESGREYEPGLVWVMFNSSDFTRPGGVGVDSQVDVNTGTDINDYSKIWVGFLKAPTTGEVTIEAEADNGLRLWMGGEQVIEGWYLGGEREGTFTGKKGELLPVRLEYFQNGDQGFLRLYWSWACQGRELIPAWAFWHTESDAKWVQDVNEGKIPVSIYEDKSSIYAPGSEACKPMPVRPGPHLFIGDYLIESSENVTREVQQPQRDPNIPNPVVTGPEDKNFQPYLTVLHYPDCNPNCFRIWYGAHTADFNGSRSHIGYLESADGINWIRPAQVLDPFPIQFGCSVIDMGPDYPNLSERYKFGYYYGGGLRIGVSPDGLTWTPLVPYTVLYHNHDINGIFWDPLLECYVATISQYTTGEKWSGERRVTMQSFSDDLIRWRIPWYVVLPDDSMDDGETQFYAMEGYLVRGSLKIGMVKVLRDDLVAEPPVDPDSYGIGYSTLAWTLDGEHWVRDQQIFFDRDHETDPVPWDHAHAWIDEQVIVGDEVYLYYGGYKQGHKVNRFEERQIGLVKMPLDRYVARKAEGETQGRILTVPLLMDSEPGRLIVNANALGGQLRVQVREANNDTIIAGLSFTDCAPITADSLRLEVHWGTAEETSQKLASLANKAIRLEFELTNAKLFGFDFVAP